MSEHLTKEEQRTSQIKLAQTLINCANGYELIELCGTVLKRMQDRYEQENIVDVINSVLDEDTRNHIYDNLCI